jgi:hypothetical protein
MYHSYLVGLQDIFDEPFAISCGPRYGDAVVRCGHAFPAALECFFQQLWKTIYGFFISEPSHG